MNQKQKQAMRELQKKLQQRQQRQDSNSQTVRKTVAQKKTTQYSSVHAARNRKRASKETWEDIFRKAQAQQANARRHTKQGDYPSVIPELNRGD